MSESARQYRPAGRQEEREEGWAWLPCFRLTTQHTHRREDEERETSGGSFKGDEKKKRPAGYGEERRAGGAGGQVWAGQGRQSGEHAGTTRGRRARRGAGRVDGRGGGEAGGDCGDSTTSLPSLSSLRRSSGVPQAETKASIASARRGGRPACLANRYTALPSRSVVRPAGDSGDPTILAGPCDAPIRLLLAGLSCAACWFVTGSP